MISQTCGLSSPQPVAEQQQQPKLARTVRCPHCPKKFNDDAAVHQHVKTKHMRKGQRPFSFKVP